MEGDARDQDGATLAWVVVVQSEDWQDPESCAAKGYQTTHWCLHRQRRCSLGHAEVWIRPDFLCVHDALGGHLHSREGDRIEWQGQESNGEKAYAVLGRVESESGGLTMTGQMEEEKGIQYFVCVQSQAEILEEANQH